MTSPRRRTLTALVVSGILTAGFATYAVWPVSQAVTNLSVATPGAVAVPGAIASTPIKAAAVPARSFREDPFDAWLWQVDGWILAGDVSTAGSTLLTLIRREALSNPHFTLALRLRLIGLLPDLSPTDQRQAIQLLIALRVDDATALALAPFVDAIPDRNLRTKIVRSTLGQMPKDQLTRLLGDADPRIRAAAATALAKALKNGDGDARQQLTDRLATEADPRIRQALSEALNPENPTAAAKPVRFGEDAAPHVTLPPADTKVASKVLSSIWDDGRCSTTVTVDSNGRALVDTVSSQGGETWHVTYPAWAWRDANGNTVIDARGQPVNYVLPKPEHNNWSPDSLIIQPDGQTKTIDDRHSQQTGDTAVPGAG